MKTFLVISLLAISATAQLITSEDIARRENAYKLETSYDKFKNLSFIGTKDMYLVPGGRHAILFNSVSLTGSIVFDGQQLPESAKSFFLSFQTRARSWRHLERSSRELVILADGARITGIAPDHKGHVSTVGGEVGTWEINTFDITRQDLAKIANAKLVELQLGSFETTLTEQHKNALKLLFVAGTK